MVKRRRTRLRDGPPPWTVRDTIQMVIVGTICFIALLFTLGVIINAALYGTPLEGGVVTTILSPLVDLLSIFASPT